MFVQFKTYAMIDPKREPDFSRLLSMPVSNTSGNRIINLRFASSLIKTGRMILQQTAI